MAATDIRGDLGEWIVSDPCSTVKHLQFILDVTAEDAGILTRATHKLVNIPLGHAVIGATIVTLTAPVGPDTIAWGISDGTTSDSWTAAGALADAYAIGDVFSMTSNDLEDTAGAIGYASTSGTQCYLTFTPNATADLTAGKFFVDIALIDVDSNL